MNYFTNADENINPLAEVTNRINWQYRRAREIKQSNSGGREGTPYTQICHCLWYILPTGLCLLCSFQTPKIICARMQT